MRKRAEFNGFALNVKGSAESDGVIRIKIRTNKKDMTLLGEKHMTKSCSSMALETLCHFI